MTTTAAFGALCETIDLDGNTIEIGGRVRSFDFPSYRDGVLSGLDTTGSRANYVDGLVEAIGEDTIESCRRYRIRVEKNVVGGEPVTPVAQEIYPPVNGTPQMRSPGVTFGVFTLA